MIETTEREVSVSGARFRYESEMIPSLRNSLPRMAFGHRQTTGVEVFSEVPAVHGIPDLAAIRFDWDAVERRRAAGVRPLATDTEVRVVTALRVGPLRSTDLARRIRMSPDYVRRAVIPLLVQQGWVTTDGASVELRPDAVWIARRVVTVEAKLRDWQRAIGQARRQQLSADAAYVALDSVACQNIKNDLDRIAAGGIGVISVDAGSGRSTVLVRPRSLSKARSFMGRMLIAERCLEMWSRGERQGQIYPVFGWSQTL